MLSNKMGHDLVQHLKATANVAKAMAIKLGLSEVLVEKIYVAGLLHDIGKAVPSFQQYMGLCIGDGSALIIDEEFKDPITGYPLHHEIGWAYLTEKLGDRNILNAVYWHHARPIHPDGAKKKKTYDGYDDVMENLSAEDKASLEGLWLELQPLIPSGLLGNLLTGNIEVPDLFDKDGSCNRNDNAEFMMVRACVISADRHVSSLVSSLVTTLSQGGDVVTNEVAALLLGSINGTVVKPEGYEQGRYDLQVGVVDSVGDARTAIVKAPAGLGKTLMGILWAKARGGRVIWVCPRNAVADAVYENIVREVAALGLNCSVELYRTGKRQETNIPGRPEGESFSSDIVVTNIDAVMSPMVNNGIAGRLFTVYGANIVLDEFHEFVSDAPLFAAFVTYMRARHRVASNCKTLLLSATPSLLHVLWDTDDRKTLILPNDLEHYVPQHSGVYQVSFSDRFPCSATPGSLLVCNSVSEAQKNKGLGYTHIIHHRYTDGDRKRIQESIYNSFGKDKTGVVAGESVSAALVVQAAMDISFRNLFDSVCSPEASLQRIGRTDRWGTFQQMLPSITFMSIGEKTEQGAIRTVYDAELQSLWYEFLKQELTGMTSVDLVQMYKIYNKFYQIHGRRVREYLIDQYKVGMNGPKRDMEFLGLVGFTPIKVLDADVSKRGVKSSAKNLRSPDGSYFYTVQYEGRPNEWLSPEAVLSEGYDLYSRYFGSGPLTMELCSASGNMLTRLKGLVNCGYAAWTRHSKGKVRIPDSLKSWFKKARSPETPLPDFSRKYNAVLGVVKIKIN